MDVADPLSLVPLCRDGSPCSKVSQWYGEEPIGSAPCVSHMLFLELPLPWGHDASASPRFPQSLHAMLKDAARQGYVTRLQCFAPDPDHSSPGWTRLLFFHRPPGKFAEFHSEEYLVPTDELTTFLEVVLLDPQEMSRYEGYRQPREGIRDLFVCTNAMRDACCGTFGYPIYERLRKQGTDRLRVWQSNHLGGHRLAPTVAEFPSGQYWGHLTPEAAETVFHRADAVESLKLFYRGWSGLKSEWEQVAEREVFLRRGWDWLAYEKDARLLTSEATSATVEIAYELPAGGVSGAYELKVEMIGSVPTLGSCGGDKLTKSRLYRVSHTEHFPVPSSAEEWPLEPVKR